MKMTIKNANKVCYGKYIHTSLMIWWQRVSCVCIKSVLIRFYDKMIHSHTRTYSLTQTHANKPPFTVQFFVAVLRFFPHEFLTLCLCLINVMYGEFVDMSVRLCGCMQKMRKHNLLKCNLITKHLSTKSEFSKHFFFFSLVILTYWFLWISWYCQIKFRKHTKHFIFSFSKACHSSSP